MGGGATPKIGTGHQLIIWHISPENCMNMKKIGPEGAGENFTTVCKSATVNTIVDMQLPQFVLITLCVVVFKALLITRFVPGI